jgi:hypothetical protein
MDSPQKRSSLSIYSRKRHPSDTSSISSLRSISPATDIALTQRLDHLTTEPSRMSSHASSPLSSFRAQKDQAKPISLVIIEKYFSDICQSIASKNSIEKNLLAKASTMLDVLKDCLTAVPDMSLQFYVLMSSALKEIQQIHEEGCQGLFPSVAKKLVQIADMIEEKSYKSQVDRVNTQPSEEINEIRGLRNLGSELNVRVGRVTARTFNLWKKILSQQREAVALSCGFLLLYCEVDNTIRVSRNNRIPADKVVNVMKEYINNPGHVVTIIRKTKEYLDKEMVSVEIIRRIHDLLETVTAEEVKNMDKTMTGFTIYELVVFAVRYYHEYAIEHYKIDIFNRASQGKESEEMRVESVLKDSMEKDGEDAEKIKRERLNLGSDSQDIGQAAKISLKVPMLNLEEAKIMVKSEVYIPEPVEKNNEGLFSDSDSLLIHTEKEAHNEGLEKFTESPILSPTEGESHSSQTIASIQDKIIIQEPTKIPSENKVVLSQNTPEKHLPIRNLTQEHTEKQEQSKLAPPRIKKGTQGPEKSSKPLPKSPAKPEPGHHKSRSALYSPSKISPCLSSPKLESKSPNKPISRPAAKPEKASIFQPKPNDKPKPATNNRVRTSSSNRESEHTEKAGGNEEVEYFEFMKEKFRHFLIEKLKRESDELKGKGLEMSDIKYINEVSATKFKKIWMEEFARSNVKARNEVLARLADEEYFNAEVARAQRQLELIEKFMNE